MKVIIPAMSDRIFDDLDIVGKLHDIQRPKLSDPARQLGPTVPTRNRKMLREKNKNFKLLKAHKSECDGLFTNRLLWLSASAGAVPYGAPAAATSPCRAFKNKPYSPTLSSSRKNGSAMKTSSEVALMTGMTEGLSLEMRTCPVCGTRFSATEANESCPVCMLRKGLAGGVESITPFSEDTVRTTLDMRRHASNTMK